MVKSQFNFICEKLGDPDLPANEKWKCLKYIFIENPIVDVQLLLRNRQIAYIDNPDIGPGFYIMGYSNSDLGIQPYNNQVITFIPLSLIDKISVITTIESDDENDPSYDENSIFVDTDGNVLILGNIEVETYEDIIIINNAVADTYEDALIIDKK